MMVLQIHLKIRWKNFAKSNKKMTSEIYDIVNTNISSAHLEAINGNLLKASGLYEELYVKITKYKEAYIHSKDEENANRFLALEFMVKGLNNECLCAEADKHKKPGKAWDYLQDALTNYYLARKISPQLNMLSRHIKHCEIMEKKFPNQLFISPAIIAKKVECSICGKDYKNCNHIAGRAYMGKLACKMYRDIICKEISLVEEPRDKKCRLCSVRLEDGTNSDPDVGLFYKDNIFEKIKDSLSKSKSDTVNLNTKIEIEGVVLNIDELNE